MPACRRPAATPTLVERVNATVRLLGSANQREAAIGEIGSMYVALADSGRESREEQLAYVILLGALVDARTIDTLVAQPAAALAEGSQLVVDQGFRDVAAWFEMQRYLYGYGHGAAAAADGVAALRRVAALPLQNRDPQVQGILTLLVVNRCCAEWRWAAAQEAIASLAGLLAERPSAQWELLLSSCRLQTFLRFGLADRAVPDLRRLEALPLDSPLRPQAELDRISYWMATDAFASVMKRVEELLAPAARPQLAEPQLATLRTARALAASALGDAAARTYLDEAEQDAAPEMRLRVASERIALALRDGSEPGFAAIGHLLDELGEDAPPDLDLRAMRAGMALRVALHAGDHQAIARAHAALSAVFDDLLGAIAAIEPRAGGIGFLHFEELQQVLGDLVDAELGLVPDPAAGANAALAHVLQAHAHGSLARSMGGPPPSVAAVQQALAGHRALVYVPSRYGSSLLLVDGRTVRHLRLAPRDAIDREVRAVNAALGSGLEAAATRKAAGRLGALLRVDDWLPAVKDCGAVWWIGGDLLANVPIECLPAGAEGALVGEVLPLTNLSSLALAARFEQAPAAAPVRRLALFATLAPSIADQAGLGTGIQPYELSASELEPLLRGFAPAAVAIDLRPTPRGFVQAKLGDYDIVHLLAHGVFDPAREQPAGLALLAGDGDDPGAAGVLWPERATFAAPTRGLVILSACGTGRTNRRTGEDLAGNLGGAFLRSGARGVVLSRARLQREWTVGLIAELQARLCAGDAPAVALQRARSAHVCAVPAARLHDAQVQLFSGGR